jgi:hypothetical protein
MSLSNAAAHSPTNAAPQSPIATGVVGPASSIPQSDAASRNPQRSESDHFIDRRREAGSQGNSERRQFGSSHEGLSDAGRELALAIDQYKLQHHRRYITCDEMLLVITRLGYSKQS